MKPIVIAHLSDLHLGYRSGRQANRNGVNWREVDGYVAFRRIVKDIINDDTVDVVLIAGDVFHTATPSVRTVAYAQREIRRLADAGMKVYILTGNHDVSDVRSEMAATALLNDPERGIFSHWEPYVVHEIAPGVLLHMVSHHLYQEQATTWDSVKPDPGAVNIFSTHGSMIDPITKMILHTEASPREVVIPDEIVEGRDWTYRLLGHIHERGYVGSSDGIHDTSHLRTYYNGSIIRRGFSDATDQLQRGWTKWTVLPDGGMTPEFKTVPQRPQIDFPIIDAKDLTASDVTDLIVDNLKSALGETPSKDDPWSAAPILRQKVVNIAPEKKRSLDSRAISEWASKALTWSLPLKSNDAPDDDDKMVRLGQSGSVTEQFDAWLKDSDEYNRLHDDIKDKVAEETKQLIKHAQESVLDGDEG